MARADILNIMYSKEKSPLDFQFDSLWMPPMYNYLTVQDIEMLRQIATSNRYAAKIELKYKAIDEIMTRRGFRKFHCGTNRIVYKYLEDESFLVKIALDKVGMGDNPREYKNQFLLKPFVTKVFHVSPCGTVAFVERVQPITSRQEFQSIAGDIFEMLINCIIGKYVLEDIGTKYFMNYGLRNGFGAVLLDYPYVFELDGSKLYCNKVNPYTMVRCDGEIDYDEGFNNLICSKCGKLYLAQELEKSIKDKLILMKEEGEMDMKISVRRGNNVIINHDTSMESDVIVRKPKTMQGPRNMTVSINDKVMNAPKENSNNKYSNGRKRIMEEKKKFNNNKNIENKQQENKKYKSNPNKFQNRKNGNKNSRLDKFNNMPNNTHEVVKPIEKILKEQEIEEVRKIVSESAEASKEIIKDVEETVINKEEVVKAVEEKTEDNNIIDSHEDLLQAYGLTDKDFEEPESYDEDDDDSIYSEY